MGELDDDGRLEDLGPGGVAEVPGDEGEHGAHPLAAGQHEMLGGLVREPVGLPDRLEQPPLDLREAGPDGVVQGRLRQAQVERGGGHRRKTEAPAAGSSSTAGATPRTIVTVAHTAIATLVDQPGRATTVDEPVGSVKYMSTNTRT